MRIHRTDPERKVAMRSILLRRLRSHPAALDGRLSIRSAEDTARDQLQRNIGDRGDGVCLPASHAFFIFFVLYFLFVSFRPPSPHRGSCPRQTPGVCRCISLASMPPRADAPPGPCRPLTGPLPSSCIRPSSLGAVVNRVRRPLKALLSPSSVASCHGRANETRQSDAKDSGSLPADARKRASLSHFPE